MKSRKQRTAQFTAIQNGIKGCAEKNLEIAVSVQELTNTAIEGILEATQPTLPGQ